MNEVLEMLLGSYRAFCLGQDSKGWTSFSDLIAQIELIINDVDSETKAQLLGFIGQFDNITRLREEKKLPHYC